VSCWWGGGETGAVVSMTVGAADEVRAAGLDSSTRAAALYDGANQDLLAAARAPWKPEYAARCEDVDRQGYDVAYACLEPAVTVPRQPAHPGSARVVLVATVRDQALVCSAGRTFAEAADAASYDGLVEDVEDLCAVVLAEVRRGG
jgi:hypothetical protein